MGVQVIQPRTIECYRCGKKETERVYGTGFIGWTRIREVSYLNEKTKKFESPDICPMCVKALQDFLDNGRH